jgi:cardiolipin synthase
LAAAFVINVALAVRIVWSKAARPNAALAWLATLFAFPILGCVLYIVIGENRIGAVRRRRHARIMRAVEQVEGGWKDPRVLGSSMSTVDTQMAHLGESSGAPQVLNGNLVQLTGDPAEQVRWITSDIDAAVRTADALFYIFETDETGRAVADALARAARRGVTVRLLVDGIGSRAFLRSPMHRELEAAGVKVVEALPATFLRILVARVDIRNHRKLVVVDGTTAQTGSRNVANPDFKASGRLGSGEPYIDSWIRIRGPLVRELQILFLEEDLQVEPIESGEEIPVDESKIVAGDVISEVGEFDTLSFAFAAAFPFHPSAKDFSGDQFHPLKLGHHLRRQDDLIVVRRCHEGALRGDRGECTKRNPILLKTVDTKTA